MALGKFLFGGTQFGALADGFRTPSVLILSPAAIRPRVSPLTPSPRAGRVVTIHPNPRLGRVRPL